MMYASAAQSMAGETELIQSPSTNNDAHNTIAESEVIPEPEYEDEPLLRAKGDEDDSKTDPMEAITWVEVLAVGIFRIT